MDLFQPNNHSKWKIDYKAVTKENLDLLRKVFLSYYSSFADDVEKIEQVAEAEVNSNNFKISVLKGGKSANFLLRRYPESRNIDSIAGAHKVLRYLKENGLKGPEIILSDKGEEIVAGAPYHYTLFKFLEADHFRGALEEIESAGVEIGKMDFLLNSLPGKEEIKKMIAFPEKVLDLRKFSTEIWVDLFKEAEKHYGNTDDEFYKKFLSLKDFILEAVAKTPPGKYDDLPKQIIHFDLHPHNLLTDGKELVAIIDFDSLRYFESMRGAAFALHRLVRQHVVFSKPQDIKKAVSRAKEIFLSAYQKFNPLTEGELGSVAYFLRHEALSRLSYAMKDFYLNSNDSWKGDLDKQTATIAEAEYFES